MKGHVRLILSLFAALFFSTVWGVGPAAAQDDITAASRGVVRIVTIAVIDDEVVGFGSGSGFAVAPNRVVTNAHVVEAAQRYPGNVVIGVVPSEGQRSVQGRLVAIDPARDLALIEFSGKSLPPLTVFTPQVKDGASVIALGYPANVDRATARSAADYINPQAPVRSPGAIAGFRELEGTHMLIHTARIARGNSGGPLLDECGRVVGVNSALTRADDGDSGFAFAIADDELLAFLEDAGQKIPTVDNACVPMSDQLAAQRDAEARASADAAAKQRQAAAEQAAKRQAAIDSAREKTDNMRENFVFLAIVLLILGVAAFGTAGLFLFRDQRQPAIIAASVGGVLLLAAILVFFLRPEFDPDQVKTGDDKSLVDVPSGQLYGKLACRVMPDQSRITVSRPTDVTLDISPDGCVNGRTQYAQDGSSWERIFVPNERQTVAILAYDPATGAYTNTRYLMSSDAMEKARQLRAQVALKSCSKDQAALGNLVTQQDQIRRALPTSYNERIVYQCSAAQ